MAWSAGVASALPRMRPLLGQPTSASSSGFLGKAALSSRARSSTKSTASATGVASQ